MKRIILSALALSMLALPVAQAQAAPMYGQKQIERHVGPGKWDKKPSGPDRFHAKPAPKKHVKHWQRGQRVPDWQRRQVVRDYHRYGLRNPGYGQQWVRVGNEYLLISIFSGIIAGLIAAQ